MSVQVLNNEIMPFNKNQLSDLVVQGNIEGAKSYIQQYFYKIDDPQCVYYYNGVEKSFSSYDIEETKFKLSKNLSYDIIENRKVKTITLYDWFKEENTFYHLKFKMDKPFKYVENGINYLNMFKGYKFQGSIEDEKNEFIEEGLKTIWNHIYEVMCSSDQDTFNYVKLWIAHFINGRKMTTCLYLKGTQGAGKSSISNFLMDVLGAWNCHKTQNPNCLTSNFNGELDSKLLLILEELRCDSVHAWEAMNSSLNNLITENTMNIEKKYKDAFLRSNHLSVIITSNNSPIKMDKNDRRYLMSDVSNHRAKDEEYFKKLYSFMKNDIIQKAFYFNCKTVASESDFKEAPELQKVNTDAKTEVIIKNLHPFYVFVKEEYILKSKNFNVFLKDLVYNYNLQNDGRRDINNIEISRLLKEINITGKASTGNKHRYTIPHGELLEIYKKLNWIHRMDEIETDLHEPVINDLNYKEEIQRLKDENEVFKKLLNKKQNHNNFISSEIEKLKDTLSNLKENKEIINYHEEFIKTITPQTSPKTAPLFPRPFKKEVVNKHDISDKFDNDVISKIFLG